MQRARLKTLLKTVSPGATLCLVLLALTVKGFAFEAVHQLEVHLDPDRQ